jgi:hypothetical protein
MKLIFLVCSLFCISAVANAAEPAARGFYIGGAVGSTEIDDDNVASDAGFTLDDSDTSFGIYGGYKILKYLSVEGRYVDLGSYSASNNFLNFSTNLDLSVISAHAVGIVPFGASGWEIFGQLGLGRMNVDTDSGDEDETVGSAGIGVRWYPIANLGLSLQVDVWAWEDDNGFTTSDVGVASTQLAAHWLF